MPDERVEAIERSLFELHSGDLFFYVAMILALSVVFLMARLGSYLGAMATEERDRSNRERLGHLIRSACWAAEERIESQANLRSPRGDKGARKLAVATEWIDRTFPAWPTLLPRPRAGLQVPVLGRILRRARRDDDVGVLKDLIQAEVARDPSLGFTRDLDASDAGPLFELDIPLTGEPVEIEDPHEAR